MSLTIASNIQSMTAARSLTKNTFALQRSIERMSTGLRLNRAGDDAAGSVLSDYMTSEIQGLNKALQNAQDGISMAQTADSGLSAVLENMQRIRELFVQGLNGTLGSDERDALQREINDRIVAISDIAAATEFNNQELLTAGTDRVMQTGAFDGETTTLALTTGAGAGANTGIDIDITAAFSGTAANNYGQLIENMVADATTTVEFQQNNYGLDDLHIANATVDSQSGTVTGLAQAGTLTDIDQIITNIGRMRSSIGAFQNSLESKIEFLSVHKENVTAARGRVRDLDIASESANLTKAQILQQTATAMLAQANTIPQAALNLIP